MGFNPRFVFLVCLSWHVLLLQADTTAAQPTQTQPTPSLVKWGSSEYYFSDVKVNWFEAERLCIARGGTLATILSQEEDNFMLDQLTKRKPSNERTISYWLDGVKRNMKYVWNDGSEMIYKNLGGGRADESSYTEGCVSVMYGPGFLVPEPYSWLKVSCTNDGYPIQYVCKGKNLNDSPSITTAATTTPTPKPLQSLVTWGSNEYYFSDVKVNWFEAERLCIARGGTLATILSQEEDNFMLDQLTKRKPSNERTISYWLDGVKRNMKYVWNDGSEMIYKNLGGGRADESSYTEGCVLVMYGPGFLVPEPYSWLKVSCTNDGYPIQYVCKGKNLNDSPSITTAATTTPTPKPLQSLVTWGSNEYYFSDVKVNWFEAERLCIARGGTLATILSQEEDNFMLDQLTKRKPSNERTISYGLDGVKRNMKYVWNDGSEMIYKNLGGGRADESSYTEGCVLVMYGPGFLVPEPYSWLKVSCTNDGYPIQYVCKGKNLNDSPSITTAATTTPTPKPLQSLVAWGSNEYYFSDVKVNWFEAERLCIARGGTLATILSQEEDNFMLDQLTKRKPSNERTISYWLDGVKRNMKYVWNDGSEMIYKNLGGGRADESSYTEGCVLVMYGPGFLVPEPYSWLKVSCTNDGYPIQYVCKGKNLNDSPSITTAATTTPTPKPLQSLVTWGSNEYYFSDVKVNWFEAERLCIARGGTLATILSQEEDNFMLDQLTKRKPSNERTINYWLDGVKRNMKYVWNDGSEMIYKNLGGGRADESSYTEGCVLVMYGPGFLVPEPYSWLKVSCTNDGYPIQYVCKGKNLNDSPSITTAATTTPTPKPLQSLVTWGSNEYYFSDVKVNWFEAERLCIARGGTLATILSQEEDNFMLDQLTKRKPSNERTISYWLDGVKRNMKYVWNDGSEMIYKNLGGGRADESSYTEGCVLVMYGPGFLVPEPYSWLKVSCTNDGYPIQYVCKGKNLNDSPTITTTTTVAPTTPSESLPSLVTWGAMQYFFSDEKLNWSESQQKCTDLGGTLATIFSQDEDDFIRGQLRDRKSPSDRSINYWLDGVKKDMKYVWNDGLEMIYTNLRSGRTNENSFKEGCVSVGYSPTGTIPVYSWWTNDCADKRFPYQYICKGEDLEKPSKSAVLKFLESTTGIAVIAAVVLIILLIIILVIAKKRGCCRSLCSCCNKNTNGIESGIDNMAMK
uniref:C-type lectin domain-containing protein n=1 Tax=Clytia hemisphaerica TaxID=252671 RepID=A0A7M6DLH3_9CNID